MVRIKMIRQKVHLIEENLNKLEFLKILSLEQFVGDYRFSGKLRSTMPNAFRL